MQNFVSFAASVAELAHGEKSCIQSVNHLLNDSVTHSRSLFYVLGTKACALEYCANKLQYTNLRETHRDVQVKTIVPSAPNGGRQR